MLEWRRRREPSTAMLYASPLIAVGLTMLIGIIVFANHRYHKDRCVQCLDVKCYVTGTTQPQLAFIQQYHRHRRFG